MWAHLSSLYRGGRVANLKGKKPLKRLVKGNEKEGGESIEIKKGLMPLFIKMCLFKENC